MNERRRGRWPCGWKANWSVKSRWGSGDCSAGYMKSRTTIRCVLDSTDMWLKLAGSRSLFSALRPWLLAEFSHCYNCFGAADKFNDMFIKAARGPANTCVPTLKNYAGLNLVCPCCCLTQIVEEVEHSPFWYVILSLIGSHLHFRFDIWWVTWDRGTVMIQYFCCNNLWLTLAFVHTVASSKLPYHGPHRLLVYHDVSSSHLRAVEAYIWWYSRDQKECACDSLPIGENRMNKFQSVPEKQWVQLLHPLSAPVVNVTQNSTLFGGGG